ncbi:uncharacterized protein LOC108099589 isoform X2 [Drosophila ficusphila]|uniref:uncharacterized protein LOC108099589 isoform X2 n=1 Tax=Drosophila ficusphila TaxID=30025 RepID=UPI0007E65E73|nr:uncharacterized protein LOC108099589 isoform X2 [Drosophila ficusphila]
MPRKKSEEFYKTHGFTANFENGKYSATCHNCDRVLQNTALSRLSLHRQTCDSRRSRCPVTYHTDMNKDQEEEGPRIKIQKISGDEDDGGLENAGEGKEIIVKIQQILDAEAEAEPVKSQPRIKTEIRKVSTPQNKEPVEQSIEFEISNVEEQNRDCEYMEESKEHYILQQNADDLVNGTTTFVEARPRNHLASLKADKTRAEIRQYQSKTKFLKTETNNLKLERTLTLLRIQKLRLEIDALRAQN